MAVAKVGINYRNPNGPGEVRIEAGQSLDQAPQDVIEHCIQQGYAERDSISVSSDSESEGPRPPKKKRSQGEG